jgi:hypothetical protein
VEALQDSLETLVAMMFRNSMAMFVNVVDDRGDDADHCHLTMTFSAALQIVYRYRHVPKGVYL